MEGESNFLSLLPSDVRREQLAYWYQGSNKHLSDYLQGDINQFDQPTGIKFHTQHPKNELYVMLQEKLKVVLPDRYDFTQSPLAKNGSLALYKLNRLSGKQASLLPEITFIMVEPAEPNQEAELFTLIRNSAHKNISSLFDEDSNRLPAQDKVTLVRGLLGSYPRAFWHLNASELSSAANQISTIKTEEDYRLFLDKYGVRRTSTDFWSFSDKLNAINQAMFPIDSGLLDYNRIENR